MERDKGVAVSVQRNDAIAEAGESQRGVLAPERGGVGVGVPSEGDAAGGAFLNPRGVSLDEAGR